MSNDITALFNGQPSVQVVQGEDMAMVVSLHGTQTSLPFDLTGVDFGIAFVSIDDRTIYRRTLPTIVPIGATSVGVAVVSLPGHGFVSGDLVLATGTGLPAPLVNNTNYMVSVVDANTIALLDATATAVAFSGNATAAWALSTSGVTVSPPLTSGSVSVMLNANFTSNIKAGIAQTFQLETFKNGLTHIYLECHQLDVLEQI